MVNLKLIHDSHVLFDDRYELKARLGGGGFSEVWLAFDTKSRNEVALKVYVQAGNLDDDGLEMFRKEFSLVCNFNHSNILRPFSYEIANNHPYLVLPYCSKGSCCQFIGKMSEGQMWHFIENVAAGLEYLHSYPEKPVIHQDIKPANILIDATGQYLITDFGISIGLRNTLSRNSTHENTGSGTISYMAPERFDKGKSLPVMSNDIWSLGATLYELATGDVPFGDFGGMTQCKLHEPPKINNEYSGQLKQLIYSCLSESPWERPTAKDLKIAAQLKSFHIKEKRQNKFKYKIALSLVALVVLAVFSWIKIDDIVKRREYQRIVTESNITAIEIMNDADSIVERHKSKLMTPGFIDEINDDTLSVLLKTYDKALETQNCSDSVYNTIKTHKELAFKELINPVYESLKGKENEYTSIGAYSAAEQFRSRRQKIESLINKDNVSIN